MCPKLQEKDIENAQWPTENNSDKEKINTVKRDR